MNAQISLWYRYANGLSYDYPSETPFLSVFNRLKESSHQDPEAFHISTERVGDVLYYTFFKWSFCCIGITVAINGYAIDNLEQTYQLMRVKLDEALAVMQIVDMGRRGAKLSNLISDIRNALSDDTEYSLTPLPPIDYSTPSAYFEDFVFGEDKTSSILSSINKGVTHIRYYGSGVRQSNVEVTNNQPVSWKDKLRTMPNAYWLLFLCFFLGCLCGYVPSTYFNKKTKAISMEVALQAAKDSIFLKSKQRELELLDSIDSQRADIEMLVTIIEGLEEELSYSRQSDVSDVFDVDEEPEFPGGQSEMMKWLSEEISYPTKAADNNIQGRVLVSFVVEANGAISNVKVVEGVEASLDAEAVRVVRLMPRWKPGKYKGRPVRAKNTLPIQFRLQ